jgi:hypothetical protein
LRRTGRATFQTGRRRWPFSSPQEQIRTQR